MGQFDQFLRQPDVEPLECHLVDDPAQVGHAV